MVSYTASNRFGLQDTGSNVDTWGEYINTILGLVDKSLDGITSFALSGNKTLTDEDSAADESRSRVLWIVSGTGGNVTVPTVPKLYLVRNDATGNVTIKYASGTTAIVTPKTKKWVFCDGTNCVRVDNAGEWILYSSGSFSGTETSVTLPANFNDALIKFNAVRQTSGSGQPMTVRIDNLTDTQIGSSDVTSGHYCDGEIYIPAYYGQAHGVVIAGFVATANAADAAMSKTYASLIPWKVTTTYPPDTVTFRFDGETFAGGAYDLLVRGFSA